MLTPEQYEEWERQQRRRYQPTRQGKDFTNYDSWKITRYDANPQRYHVNAHSESKEHYSRYADRGVWTGGREIENRLFEELQFAYHKVKGATISRTQIDWNCKFYEVTVYGKPESAFMIVDGSKTYMATKTSQLKDGYRWHMDLIAV